MRILDTAQGWLVDHPTADNGISILASLVPQIGTVSAALLIFRLQLVKMFSNFINCFGSNAVSTR